MNCPKCGAADFYESIFNGGVDCRNSACEYGPKTTEPVAKTIDDTSQHTATSTSVSPRPHLVAPAQAPEETRTEMELLCSTFDIDIEVTFGAHNRHRDPDWHPAQSWHIELTRADENGLTLSLETDFFGGDKALEPTVADALHCMVSDTWGVRCVNDDFEDWCSNTGYDSDSRKAEALFNRCLEQADRVEAFLDGIFDQFTDAEH